jgi:O-antigen/teichoic acid export membrane protein
VSGLRSAAVSGVRWLGTASVVVAGIRLVQLAILGRLLGPEAFGLMAMAMVFTGFATAFSQAGVPEYIVQRRDLAPEDLSSLYWLNVVVAAAVYGVILAAAPWIAAGFGSAELVPVLNWVAASLLIAAFATVHRGLCQKRLDFRRIAGVEMTGTLVTAGVSLALAILASAGVWALVWGFLAGNVTQTVAYLWLGRGLGFSPRLVWRGRSVRDYAGFGAFRVGDMVLNLVRSRVDQLLIGLLLGAGPLGFYNLATNLVMQPIQRVNPVLNRVAFPVFAEIRDETARLRNGYLRLLGMIAIVNAPLLVGAAAVAPLGVALVLGPAWLPMVPLVQLLAVYALLRSLANVGGNVVLARGRADWMFRWNLALILVTPPVVFAAARFGGAATVALALALLQVPLTLLNYRLLVRPLVGPSFAGYARAAGVPLLLGAVMGLGVAALPHALGGLPPAAVLAAQVGAGAIVYTLLLWSFQRQPVRDALGLLRGRP